MNIAVVGGSGFIGSNVVDELVEQGHEVTVYDIMKPGREDVRHIYTDITSLSKTVVATAGDYDAIYMMAAMANVNDVENNPIESIPINITSVGHILEAARRNGIGRVIFSSTAWVYQMAEEEPVQEDTPLTTDNVDHLYTASKLSAEMLCRSYKEMYDQDYTIARYGIPYGPGARHGTVLSNFAQRALNGEPLQIYGDGTAQRNFVYIDDLAKGNVALLQDEAKNEIYNLPGPDFVSVKELAQIVSDVLGDVEVEHVDKRNADYQGKRVKGAKARKQLGWEPTVGIQDGVRKYIEWFRDQ